MKNLTFFSLTVIFLFSTINIFADTEEGAHSVSVNIPKVALLDIEGGTSVILSPTAPTEAGSAFDFTNATDNSTWINYSSVVAKGKKRNVTAAITSGDIPSGLLLKVQASSYSGNGKGDCGNSEGEITLSGSSQSIIKYVKTCYTGNGTSNGHSLTYSLELENTDNYKDLVQATTSITITYTLTEDD
jgi:hypothetical protein